MSQKQQQIDQKQQERNEQYNAYVKQVTPTHNLWANMGKAFVLGGAICLLGQIILNIAMGVFGATQDDAALWCSLVLVLLSVILTSFNVYGLLANWGGAGALVPITGFANGVCSSAVEFQKEGQVFGIGCQDHLARFQKRLKGRNGPHQFHAVVSRLPVAGG